MHQLDRFKSIPGVVHGFSEIKDGNMSFSWGSREEASVNRRKFFERMGVEPANSVVMFLKHGTDIAVVDESSRGNEAFGADCLITKSKNVFLSVLTADCLPVILFDKVTSALALAHLSRINSPQNFARTIIEKMKSECGSKPENIIVGIGPHIRKESYVFDENEFSRRVPDEKIFKGFVLNLPGGSRYAEGYGEASKKAIDLTSFNASEFVFVGVPKENLEISEVDTFADKNFFSHRRSRSTGEQEGRMLTVVGRVENLMSF